MSTTLRSVFLLALTGVVACGPPTRPDDDDETRFCSSAAECFNGETCVGRRCVPGCVDDGDCESGTCDRQAGVCVEPSADGGEAFDGGEALDGGELLDAGEPVDGGGAVDAGEAQDGGEAPDAGDVPDAGEEPDGEPCATNDDCELPLACHPVSMTCEGCDEENLCPTGSTCHQGACWSDADSCVLTVAPEAGMFGAALNFGQVRVDTEKVLPATFTNVGSGPCTLSNARISSGGGLPGLPNDAPYFAIKSVPAGPLLPGQSATVEVAFTPDSERDYGTDLGLSLGGVSLLVNTNDVVTFDGSGSNACTSGFGGAGVPGCVKWGMSGSGIKSDLAVLPGDIDFGVVTPGCRSREMTITLYNIGAGDLTITEIVVDPASTPQIFHVVSPPLPMTLTGGQQLQLTVRYRPPDDGLHTASIRIKSDATNATVTNPYIIVGLRGDGSLETHQTDVFDQSTRPKSDVLFVVDDSGSMSEEQNALASNAQRFINVATSLNTDFQIGVITTDPDNKPGQLRGTPSIIKNGATAASEFSKTVRDLGTNGSGTEKGLQVMVDALTPPAITDPNINGGFLRSDARLAVIVVSDEDDFSSGTVDFYTDFLKNIKGIHNQGLVTLSAVVGEPGGCSTAAAGDRYIAVQQRTNGKFRSICSTDWGQIADDLALDAFGSVAGFPLSRVAVPGSIEVQINGQPSLEPAWSYDAPSNSVVFDAANLPDPGAAVIIGYEAACL